MTLIGRTCSSLPLSCSLLFLPLQCLCRVDQKRDSTISTPATTTYMRRSKEWIKAQKISCFISQVIAGHFAMRSALHTQVWAMSASNWKNQHKKHVHRPLSAVWTFSLCKRVSNNPVRPQVSTQQSLNGTWRTSLPHLRPPFFYGPFSLRSAVETLLTPFLQMCMFNVVPTLTFIIQNS